MTEARLSTWQSLAAVTRSWRLLSVTLLSFPSGLPLGLVWMAIPTWLAREGVDIRTVGLITLSQAPWSFKFLWAPLMDRWSPPLLGRKRGWMLLTQVALAGLGLALASQARPPLDVAVVGVLALLTAFASASQDIAYDAYAVEVLRREEHGLAVGARNALARAGLFVAGRVSVTAGAFLGWPLTHGLLAALYAPAAWLTWRSPEPEEKPAPPPTLRDALWGPFVGLLAQHRSVEILAFVVLYKLSDNLTQALTGPFLVKTGFNDIDVGVAVGTVGMVASLVGAFLGGMATDRWGLGRALWVFGLLQVVSNVGYAAVAVAGPNRWVMYSAVAFELGTSGLGTGAFGVLLLRLTAKRFSATQFALLSSLFAVPRVFAGPVAGVVVDALALGRTAAEGWRDFYLLTLLTGVPGLVMLARFVPWGTSELEFRVEEARAARPLGRGPLLGWATATSLAALALGLVSAAALDGFRGLRQGRAFALAHRLGELLAPSTVGQWTTLAGCLAFAAVTGLGVAALLVARRGLRSGA